MNQFRLSKNIALEITLIDRLPVGFQDNFRKKLNENNNSYWQTLSEARAIIIFNNLGIQVKEIDVKTIKNKNVDFFVILENEKIYSEVKGFVPEDYEVAKRGSNYFDKQEYEMMIERALKRANKKFIDENLNIVVIADENSIKSSLFREPLLNNLPEDVLWNYPKISAVMILGEYNNEDMFKYKIWYNIHSQKSLSKNLINILNTNKTQHILLE